MVPAQLDLGLPDELHQCAGRHRAAQPLILIDQQLALVGLDEPDRFNGSWGRGLYYY